MNPSFRRTENINVYDLKGLSRAQVTSDTMEVVRIAGQIMCSFPETLHCLLIINAPTWFGVVWSVVKKLIDARTASKIEVFTNAKSGSKRMEELIELSQIPSCFGGSGPSLAESAASSGDGRSSGMKSKVVVLNHLMHLSKKSPEKSFSFELDDVSEVSVYTRCNSGAIATLLQADTDNVVKEIDIVGGENDDEPYSTTFGTVAGGKFTVVGRGGNEPGVFLVLATSGA